MRVFATVAFSFLMVAAAQAGTETALYTFTGGTDGATPLAGLTRDSSGNLYGTASTDATGGGLIFELMPNSIGGGWTEKVLHTLAGGTEGCDPQGKLVFDAAGNLYGTAVACGINLGYGTIFELSPQSDGTWDYKVLYRFSGGADGGRPNGLVLDPKGNLWGTSFGGTLAGSIFSLSPGSGGTWSFHLRWVFQGGNEGAGPFGNLALDTHGNFYGTTGSGGTSSQGTVYAFKFVSGTGQVHPTPLHAFTGGSDGAAPLCGVILNSAGTLFGTTSRGGTGGFGTAFQLSQNSSGHWVGKTLHAFSGGDDGANPSASLIFDTAGSLYGTAPHGGSASYGTIFKLLPMSTGGWGFGTLYAFSGGSDGALPLSDLILDGHGNLYGTASGGGSTFGYRGFGVVFQVIP